MSLVHATVKQNAKMLENLDRWLTKAEEHAVAKAYKADTLLVMRLAPNQHTLCQQIQSACDTAKLFAARLSGKEAPVHPDTETTIAELRARIADVRRYLGTFTVADFVGAEARRIVMPVLQGRALIGTEYITAFGVPNFHFHVVTAYAILRHVGVDLGKRDYLGALDLVD